MKLSVIIPVYNCEKYVGRCIDSVLRQQLDEGDEMQIIIIDDGSTDKSGEIVDRYAAENSNIQVVHQSNQGVSTARNNGLDLADGDYIHFVDSDDFLLYDNSYQWLLALIKKDPVPIDILTVQYVSVYEGNPLDIQPKHPIENDIDIEFEGSGKEACNKLLFNGQIIFSLYRRSLIEKIQLRFDDRIIINEDVFFNLKLYLQAERVILLGTKIYAYFRNKGSITLTTDKNKLQSVIDNLFDSLPATLKILDDYDVRFKTYRIGILGETIARRMIMANLPLKQTRIYIKKGFDTGVLPICDTTNEAKTKKMLNFALHSPTFFWIMSYLYRYIYLRWIKSFVVKNG